MHLDHSSSDEPLPAGLVAPVCLDPTGMCGPTEGQARGRRWRRTSQGRYVASTVDGSRVEQRIVEAAAVLPEVAGVTGWAGLRWLGGDWFSGLSTGGQSSRPVVIVTADANVRDQPGIVISQERLDPAELVVARGLVVTWPERSACFEARYSASLAEAVVAWDMAAFHDLVSTEEAWTYCLSHPGWTGIPRARKSLALAVENSWSPMETRLRLVWELEAGLPRPLCNVPIFDRSGNHLGTPDLFDPERAVIGEYDGALHLEGARRARDLVREGELRNHGLEYATVLSTDMRTGGRVAERIWSAYRRARPVPERQRSWTLTPPPWWRATTTVAQRRLLSQQGLERLLPNRRAA